MPRKTENFGSLILEMTSIGKARHRRAGYVFGHVIMKPTKG